MSNEIVTTNADSNVTKELLMDYLKTITNSLNDTQRMQFVAVAQAFNLNPFKREIYATTYKDKDGKINMSVVVGYEVYLKRAEMNPNFDGYETEFHNDKENGMSCTCIVYRKDRQHHTKSTVYMNEYSTGRSLWLSKPKIMLEKVAICTAFRRAFPTDFGGIPYAPEEISASEQLQQQGYTEVHVEEKAATAPAIASEPDAETKTNNFIKAMGKLKKINEKAYTDFLNAAGYKSESDVEPEYRRSIHDGIKAELEKLNAKNNANTQESNNG